MIFASSIRVHKSGQTILHTGSFQIEEGEKIVIEGTNGSGKTTLLKVLAGLESEFAGELKCTVRSEEMTYVHQDPYMFRGTVLDNLLFGLNCRNASSDEKKTAIEFWTKRFELGNLLNRKSSKLSGGEKKKVAIARAVLVQPKLLLVDEPVAELDEANGTRIVNELFALDDTTVIIAVPYWDNRFKNFRRVKMSEICET